MEEAQQVGDVRAIMEEEPVARIFDHATTNSNIQTPTIPQEVGNLGKEAGGLLATQLLANAGIVVELVGGDVEKDDNLFEWAQIVDEDEITHHLQKFGAIEEVCLVPTHNMLGFQIKLDGQRKWKVKIMDENKERHKPAARSARSGAGDSFREFTNHNLHEIFVPHHNDMRATIAVSNAIVNNVLFKLVADGEHKGECEWGEDKHGDPSPPVYQRRIDIVFHNKFCARLQVRSAFCVPRSVFQI